MFFVECVAIVLGISLVLFAVDRRRIARPWPWVAIGVVFILLGGAPLADFALGS